MALIRRSRRATAYLLPLAVIMTSCGSAEEGSAPSAASTNATLVEAITATDNLDTVSEAISNAQLSGVFDGAASYTILAPTDVAFEKLGQDGALLMTQDQRPILVEVLRNHIVTGHVTLDGIEEAIVNGNGEATMQTVGKGSLTFRRSGDRIIVSHSAGGSATLGETSTDSTNGVAIPIDAVLLPEAQ